MRIELDLEEDGRWIAEVPDIPGAMAYGQSRHEAIKKVEAIALRVIADRIEHGETVPERLFEGKTMKSYVDFLTMLSSEFHRYLMENEKNAKELPENALVIFQVEGETDFNRWNKETSLRNREKGQQISYVHVRRWRKHSAIEEVSFVSAAG